MRTTPQKREPWFPAPDVGLTFLALPRTDDPGDIGLLVALRFLEEGVVVTGGRDLSLLAEIDDLLVLDRHVLAGLLDLFEADGLGLERHGLDLRLDLLPHLRHRRALTTPRRRLR